MVHQARVVFQELREQVELMALPELVEQVVLTVHQVQAVSLVLQELVVWMVHQEQVVNLVLQVRVVLTVLRELRELRD